MIVEKEEKNMIFGSPADLCVVSVLGQWPRPLGFLVPFGELLFSCGGLGWSRGLAGMPWEPFSGAVGAF